MRNCSSREFDDGAQRWLVISTLADMHMHMHIDRYEPYASMKNLSAMSSLARVHTVSQSDHHHTHITHITQQARARRKIKNIIQEKCIFSGITRRLLQIMHIICVFESVFCSCVCVFNFRFAVSKRTILDLSIFPI